MRNALSLKEKGKKIIEFIKKNPTTTYKDIRKKIKIHPERIFKKGLKEAFLEAGIELPRTFEIKTKEERKKIIVDYIQKNPTVGGHIIKRDTKINISNAFKNIKEAYKEAGVKYPREQSYKKPPIEKRKELIKLLRENPQISIPELIQKVRANPYRYFKGMGELYRKAGIKKISGHEKRRARKRQEVIEFIKNNPLTTQREINKACKTHVQLIFGRGIFEAYEKASIIFPYKRLKLYGTTLKNIKQRAKTFEDNIAVKLSGYGKVNRLVKTKRGFADIILERKDKKIIIEVKDYQAKEISISQIKQLNKYLEDCNCNLGFLICYKKPKKDKFLIGRNKIVVLEESELNKIPELLNGTVV